MSKHIKLQVSRNEKIDDDLELHYTDWILSYKGYLLGRVCHPAVFWEAFKQFPPGTKIDVGPLPILSFLEFVNRVPISCFKLYYDLNDSFETFMWISRANLHRLDVYQSESLDFVLQMPHALTRINKLVLRCVSWKNVILMIQRLETIPYKLNRLELSVATSVSGLPMGNFFMQVLMEITNFPYRMLIMKISGLEVFDSPMQTIINGNIDVLKKLPGHLVVVLKCTGTPKTGIIERKTETGALITVICGSNNLFRIWRKHYKLRLYLLRFSRSAYNNLQSDLRGELLSLLLEPLPHNS